MSRVYPDETAREFERPPFSFRDKEGREITIRAYEGDWPDGTESRTDSGDIGNEDEGSTQIEGADDTEIEAVFSMYTAFDPADRAQGIPPARESRISEWLETIVADGCDVLAWYGEQCVGHATLVPDGETGYELAIFVLSEYQRAGIGSQLMEGLLGYGQTEAVERVWLTVERWNDVAMALYRKFGFETGNTESFELEMALRLG